MVIDASITLYFYFIILNSALTVRMQTTQALLLHGIMIRNAVLKHVPVLSQPAVVSRLLSTVSSVHMGEQGFESTTIADDLKAKAKRTDSSWLWCTTNNTVYDSVQSVWIILDFVPMLSPFNRYDVTVKKLWYSVADDSTQCRSPGGHEIRRQEVCWRDYRRERYKIVLYYFRHVLHLHCKCILGLQSFGQGSGNLLMALIGVNLECFLRENWSDFKFIQENSVCCK